MIYLPGTDCEIRPQVPLATLTSLRVGGPAQWYAAPRNLADLQASLEWAQRLGLEVTMLGAGSNLLVSDHGIPGLVISTRHLRATQFNPETGELRAGAGEHLPRLAWQAAAWGWQGLEWAVGIPGTVGGAVVMNAGAHSNCVAKMLVETCVLSPTGSLETFTPQQLGYSYRTSMLQGNQYLVTQATFQLQPGADPAQVKVATGQHLEQRQITQPYHLPSCGSVFRNPKLYTAGWLIEQTGLKGYQIGAAQVAERHANFILNCGGATASDIFRLIFYIQQQVEKCWSVWLEPEVKFLGEFL
ncbi:MAG: UDP-N-acetylmuramate dehydrogenase [Chroococcidiopsidaceae cyanobacterium CP_BM_RX_35]|nr:UDP-N-acetylmuramate dehydrogenase [Chroococcidiopsidaceae cyanobacterium CP_BM_RX_35]